MNEPASPEAEVASDAPSEAHGRFAALSSPAFRLLMSAGMVMQLGGWIQRVALSWVVYELTGSAVALGGLQFLTNISVIVLSPMAGIAADRFGARRVLMLASIGQAAAASVLAQAVYTEHASLGLLYAVGAIFGIGQALNQPTRNLLVYDSVGRDRLRNGLALNALTGGWMRIIGPSVGGVLIAIGGGAGLAFGLQALLLTIAVVLVWLLPIETTRSSVSEHPLSALRGGMRHFRENALVRRSVIISALTAGFVYPYLGFIPVFAVKSFNGGSWEQGILFSAGGVGSMIGLWYVMAGRGGMRSMLWTGTAYMTLVIAFTQSSHFWLGFGLLVAAGAVHSVFSTLNQALVQLNAREEFRARIMGIYSMVGGIEPFSALLLGVLIDTVGIAKATGSYVTFAMLVTLAFAISATIRERRGPEVVPDRA